MNDHRRDHENGLEDLVDAVLAEFEMDRQPDAPAMAQRFSLDIEQVEKCIEGLRGIKALADLSSIHLDFDDSDDSPPSLPEDYEVIDELGRGGMGIVFRAHQKSLDRDVALKVLRPAEQAFARSLARFRQEARSLAKLRHPNIVTIHEVGDIDGNLYFTMDLIEGRSLDQIILNEPMTPSRAVALVKQVAEAIAYTHERGLIHRDLKPHNILVDANDRALVTDFGLVLSIDNPQPGLTQTGQILGTPSYMSPEQARGDAEAMGESTDIWALGAVLYTCLCGQAPFPGTSPVQVLHEVINRPANPPRKLNRNCPLDLEAICMQALAKAPEDRYLTARAFLEDLERFDQGRAVRARRTEISTHLYRAVKRQAVPIAAAIAAMAVLLGILALTVFPRLGNDPATANTIGDELWESGQREAALDVYTHAFDDENPDGRIFLRICEAQIEKSRKLRRDGKASEALSLLTAAHERMESLRDSRLPRKQQSDWRKLWSVERDLLVERLAALVTLEPEPEPEDLAEGLRALSAVDDPDQPIWNRQDPTLAGLVKLLDDEDVEVRRWARRTMQKQNISVRDQIDEGSPHRAFILACRAMSDLDEGRLWGTHALGNRVDDGLCRQFEALARNDELTPEMRRLSAYLLALLADLPSHRVLENVNQWSEGEIQELIETWRRLESLSHEERRRLRLDRALEFGDDTWPKIADWWKSLALAPAELKDPAAARIWWQKHRNVDPSLEWSQRIGIPANSTPRQFVLAQMHGSEDTGRLLAWSRPVGATRPITLSDMATWQSILDDEGMSHGTARLKVASFATRGLLPDDKPLDEGLVSFPIQFSQTESRPESVMSIAVRAPRPTAAALDFSVPTLDALDTRIGAQEKVVDLRPIPRRLNGRLDIEFPKIGSRMNWQFGQIETLDPTQGKTMEHVAILINPFSFSFGLKDHERQLVLAHVSVDREPDPIRTLDDWRRAVCRCLEAEARAFTSLEPNMVRLHTMRRFGPMVDLALAAFVLCIPEAATSIKTILSTIASPVKSNQSSVLIRGVMGLTLAEALGAALLASGDASAIDSFKNREPAPNSVLSPEILQNKFWVHLAVNSPNEATRQFAAMEFLKANAETDDHMLLEQASRHGTSLPDELSSHIGLDAYSLLRATGKSFVRHPLGTLLTGICWLLTGLLLFRFSRSATRESAAYGLTILGLAATFVSFEVDGMEMIPDAPGWGLAALGSWYLGRRREGPNRFVAPWGFLSTLGLDLMVSGGVPGTYPFFAAAQLVGLAGLAILAFRSFNEDDGPRPVFGRVPMRFWGGCGLLILAAAYVLKRNEFSDEDARLLADSAVALALIGGGVFGLMSRGRRPSPQIPTIISLIVILPLSLSLHGRLLTEITGFDPKWTGLDEFVGTCWVILFATSMFALAISLHPSFSQRLPQPPSEDEVQDRLQQQLVRTEDDVESPETGIV